MALCVADRAFVQAMIGAGALSEKKATALFNKCTEASGTGTPLHDDGLSDVADRINSALRLFDMQLAAAGVPGRGIWWGLVNTARDDAAEHACLFTQAELVLFHAVSSHLQETGGVMSLADAHNKAPACKMRVADGARAIQRLANLQWLRVVRAAPGRGAAPTVTFGPRALLELPEVRAWAREEAAGGQAAGEEEEEEDDEIKTPKKLVKGRRGRSQEEEEDRIEPVMKQEKDVRVGRRKPPSAPPKAGRRSVDSDHATPIARPSTRRVTRSRYSQSGSEDASSQGSKRVRRKR